MEQWFFPGTLSFLFTVSVVFIDTRTWDGKVLLRLSTSPIVHNCLYYSSSFFLDSKTACYVHMYTPETSLSCCLSVYRSLYIYVRVIYHFLHISLLYLSISISMSSIYHWVIRSRRKYRKRSVSRIQFKCHRAIDRFNSTSTRTSIRKSWIFHQNPLGDTLTYRANWKYLSPFGECMRELNIVER